MQLEAVQYRTNYHDIEITANSLYLYQYIVETEPPIPSDSPKIWYKLAKDLEKKLQKEIGLISHRSNILWGNKKLDNQSLSLVWMSKYFTKL